MKLLRLALLCGVCPVLAQRVEVSLAADPTASGPSALVWLRTRYLPTRPEWPSGLAPLMALDLTLSGEGTLGIRGATVPPDGYLQARVALGGSEIVIQGDADGLERWHFDTNLTADTSLTHLVRLLRTDLHIGPCTLDLPTVVGNLLPGMVNGDPMQTLLGIGAAECGAVTWVVWKAAKETRVQGRSDGGLLLPAILAVIAHRRGGSFEFDPVRSWTLLAAAARDEFRDEAARQLARYDAKASRNMLEALLYADDHVRIVAMESLLRLGDGEVLPGVASAASVQVPGSEAMAELVLRQLWPKTQETTRSALLTRLQQHASERMRALPAVLDQPVMAGVTASAPATPPNRGVQWTRNQALALLSAAGLGLWLALSRAHRS